ncbi:hypothetical protein GM418_13880 [Maribellus comscasis]|uniref:Uncharacterized protein n=1 Tax=Maribellus comscasis TaxID=2681766 RepID=A0A6I6JP19_9BACT|nr:hypothetical protein [Maribellus comscasis]QGY44716.1 hypothetical protein GM418_13880 [Maribellus comscasis]
MIFNIFKKDRRNNQSIAIRLTEILNQQPNNLHLMFYIKDQILFQVMPAKNFQNKGLKILDPNDFVAIHFFNKNKTLTFDKLEKFKNSDFEKEYHFYEEPKGNFNYLKIIGQEPSEIEKEVFRNFKEIYELDDLSEISIEYADY